MRRSSSSWASALRLAWALAALPTAAHGQEADLPPAGFGTLRQDQVGVRLQTENLQVRVLPLDESVIRLLSADAYRALRDLAASRAADVRAAARAAGHDSVQLFFVQFFALQPQVRFSPDQLYITSQNTSLRPVGIVPITPRWSEYQIDQRQQAAAIYLFEPIIPVLRPFAVSYADRTSQAWSGILQLLDAERARALARSRQAGRPSPPTPAP